jgi:glycosyltransferase involved in cell wall biosynthesis
MSRISAIIAASNGTAALTRSIDSALAQNYAGGLEVIVVDDESAGSKAEILQRYGDVITFVRREVQGIAAARNLGAAHASGEILAFLDSGDVWLPSKLTRIATALERDQDAIIGYSDVLLVDDGGEELPHKLMSDALMHAPSMEELSSRWWPILPSTVIVRRKAFQQCGGFCTEYQHAYDDVDLWLRAREAGHFVFVPERLVRYRVTAIAERLRKYSGDFAVFERRIRSRYGSRGRELLRRTRHAHVSQFEFEGLTALRAGNRRRAREAFTTALHYDPWQFRTMLRIARTILPFSSARRLDGQRGRDTSPSDL